MDWCQLTLTLEGSALDEMDIVPDKNAYAVWQHLRRTYEKGGGMAYDNLEMKFGKCELEFPKKANDFSEIDTMMDAD